MRITEEAVLKIEKKLITYMMIGDNLGVHDNKTDTKEIKSIGCNHEMATAVCKELEKVR